MLEPYLTAFLDYLEKEHPQGEPESLYTPSTYILGLGGKRVRPVLTLMAADICQSDFRAALPAALAVEVFHNFSLVHDDIMDAAPLRRGKPTVHQKWDVNTGILKAIHRRCLSPWFLVLARWLYRFAKANKWTSISQNNKMSNCPNTSK
ncbi:MAG: polyprenyl synthetase family protein [Flavobacteriaceae bacterium]